MENKKTRPNFDEAAYLVANDYVCTVGKLKDGKTTFSFADAEMVEKDLEQYKANEVIQGYVKGVIALRKLLRDYRRNQKTQSEERPTANVVEPGDPPENTSYA